jgi:hypothetical protein
MVDYSVISLLLTGISISLAAIYYTLTLRRGQESINIQAYMQAYQKAQDQGFLETLSEALWVHETVDFDSWWSKYGPENNMEYFKRWYSMLVFFEGIGVQIKRGLIDLAIVDDMMSGPVLICWDRYEPVIMGIREKYGYPQFQEYQEYLVNEVRKIVNRQHPDYKVQ